MLQNSSKIRIVSQCDSIFVYMFPWAWIVDFFFCPFDVHWIWFVCLLHLSHHVIYFLLTTKSVLLKKNSPSHHQLTCWFRLYWSYVSFTTSCIILGTQNLALNFIYYSSSLLFYLFYISFSIHLTIIQCLI